MDRRALAEILARVRAGDVTIDVALEALRDWPFADLAFAKPDLHRALRTGQAEVIFGAGKTAVEIAAIAERLTAHGQNVLVTRLDPAPAADLLQVAPAFVYHPGARVAVQQVREVPITGKGTILVVTAGTSDGPVAEEAAPTSVGYGASFGGVAALLAMLNSCAAGLTVVNIDNGFGAGVAASRINHL